MNFINKIEKSFDRAVTSYEKVAKIQLEVATSLGEKIVSLLDTTTPKTILDLGTGTGNMIKTLMPSFPDSLYVLNDLSLKMLESCQKQFPFAEILPGDLETLEFPCYDLIVSNFAFQWVENLPKVLSKYYEKSRLMFAFSTLTKGTFQEWYDLVFEETPLDYPSHTTLQAWCQTLAPTCMCESLEIPVSFESIREFLFYLRALGAGVSFSPISLKGLRDLLRKDPLPFTTSYRIFIAIFRKI